MTVPVCKICSRIHFVHVVIFGFHFHRSRDRHAADTHCPGAIKIIVDNRSSLLRNAKWKQPQRQHKMKSNWRKKERNVKANWVYAQENENMRTQKKNHAFRKIVAIAGAQVLDLHSTSLDPKSPIFQSIYSSSSSPIIWRIKWKGKDSQSDGEKNY